MAETSGFFDAVYDETLKDYDLKYLAAQFAEYFSLFVGNGVFASPTNQLKVSASEESLAVIVSSGWAFIGGYWYHNNADLSLSVPSNLTSQIRTDSVRCRYTVSDRSVKMKYVTGDVIPVRNTEVYDLIIAQVIVQPVSSSISNSDITDTRMNESVCGFVKGLLEVETTEDLFAQYNTIFTEWFEGIKGQLSEDAAGNLQAQIGTLSNLQTYSKSNLVSAINEVSRNAGVYLGAYKIPAGQTSFTISDASMKPTSIVTVFYSDSSLSTVNDMDITYEQSNGSFIIALESALDVDITIDYVQVVNPVKSVADNPVGTIDILPQYVFNNAASGTIKEKEE